VLELFLPVFTFIFVYPVLRIALASANGKSFARHDDGLYLLGAYHQSDHAYGSAGHQVLARASAQGLVKLDLASIEVMASTVSSATWYQPYSRASAAPGTAVSTLPHALYAPLLSEASLHYDSRLREWLATSLVFWEDKIQVCRTPSIEAREVPWNCSYVAKVQSADKLVSYAAKAHPHLMSSECPREGLSTDGPLLDLVISYVSNAMDSGDILYEPQYRSAYTPKFVRVQGLPVQGDDRDEEQVSFGTRGFPH
jgi:hypothetical protein